MSKTSIVREYLDKFPNINNHTLAKKLVIEHPEVFVNEEKARGIIRGTRGTNGRKLKEFKAYEKNNSDYKVSLPPSREEKWVPVKVSKPGPVLILSDIHIPFHNKRALELALRYGKDNGAKTILLNGDIGDYPQISRFERDPRNRKIKKDIEAIAALLNTINDLFPDADKYFKEGNHEERWAKYLWNAAPLLYDFEHIHLDAAIALEMSNKQTIDIKSLGWQYVEDGRPVMLGSLPVLHGHELPKGVAMPVNPARGAFMRALHTLLVSHSHRTSTHTEPDLFQREIVTWSTGCLCGLTPKWNRLSKWNHGFALVNIINKKDFDVQNLRVSSRGNVRSA